MQIGNLWFEEQWREESPSVYQFDEEHTASTITFDVTRPNTPLEADGYIAPSEIAKVMLHWSSYDRQARRIRRHLPMSLYDPGWLYAHRICNMHGLGASTPMRPVNPIPGYTIFGNAKFKRWRVTALFDSLPYEVYPDQLVTKEYQRYVIRQYTPGIECITRRNGQYFFANGPGTVFGQPFAMGINRRVAKSHITWEQKNVPVRAVMGPNMTLSPNIVRGLGCVNLRPFPQVSTAFDPSGVPAGTVLNVGATVDGQFVYENCFGPETLLLTQVGYKLEESPVYYADAGITNFTTLTRSLSLVFHFLHFDPPQDPGQDYGGYGGHNLVPAVAANRYANYFYVASAVQSIVRADAMAGPKLYETYDFERLFETL